MVALPFLAHGTGYLNWTFLDRLENFSYDARLLLTMPRTRDDRVVIVDVDEKSLGEVGQWPWPRDRMAALTDQLFTTYDVRVVGYDMVFAEADRQDDLRMLSTISEWEVAKNEEFENKINELKPSLARDAVFADSLYRGPIDQPTTESRRHTVLGYLFRPVVPGGDVPTRGSLPTPVIAPERNDTAIDIPEPEGFTGNLTTLQDAALAGGFFENELFDVDGVFRRVPLLRKYQGAFYESLALAVVRAARGMPPVSMEFHGGRGGARDGLDLERVRVGDLTIPVDQDLGVLIPYRGPSFSFPYVSAADVLAGRAPQYPLNNSIVLLGTSAPGLFDMRTTPTGRTFTGVEIHANLISGILDQRIKHRPLYMQGITVTLLAVIALLMTVLIPRMPVVTGTLFTLLMIVIVSAVAYLVWENADLVMPVASPILFIVSVFFLQLIYGFRVESVRKRRMSMVFGQYVPPELVHQLDNNPKLKLESDSRELTVIFTDVRNFTRIAEGLAPNELSTLMNDYLTPMTKVIHRHGGTIDKYMGDSIMAFWGAPITDPNHARHALLASLEMHGALAALMPEFRKRGWPEMKIGIGINTGVMRVGNMGSDFRMAYTVMGDAVNLAARLEGLTKQYGSNVIVGEGTASAVADFAFMELDRVRVKGKDDAVAIFEPIGPYNSLSREDKGMLSKHHRALKCYRASDWDTAETEFFNLYQSFPNRKVFQVYLDRIANFRSQPPNPEWSGVYRSLAK